MPIAIPVTEFLRRFAPGTRLTSGPLADTHEQGAATAEAYARMERPDFPRTVAVTGKRRIEITLPNKTNGLASLLHLGGAKVWDYGNDTYLVGTELDTDFPTYLTYRKEAQA